MNIYYKIKNRMLISAAILMFMVVNRTSETYSGRVGKAYLLRDETDSLRFISFGPWDGEITIRNWRNSNEFKEFAEKIAGLCDDFQPNTLKVASSSE